MAYMYKTASTHKLSFKNKLKTVLPAWIIPLGLSLFSIIEVFSASRYKAVELTGKSYYFATMHMVWIIIALIVGFAVFTIGSKVYKRIPKPGYTISIVLLVSIFLAPSYNGAHRWLNIGNFTTFQPSEIVKILLILFTAYYLNSKHKNLPSSYSNYFDKYLKPFVFVTGIPLALIVLEPDLSTALVLGFSVYSMLLLHDSKFLKQNLVVLSAIAIGFAGIAILAQSYRGERLKTYLHLLTTGEVQDKYGKGYQMYNILIGIGSGGILGKGLGQSRQKEGYLLETTAFTDSIVAVIFEELGFILSVFFIGIYFYYFFYLAKQSIYIQDQFDRLVLWGIANLLIVQTIIHISANLGLIPLTGIALPFITYGGTSMITNWTLVAIATRIILENKKSITH